MNALLLANTLLLTLLSLVWSQKNWPNLFVKLGLIFFSIANGLAALRALGYLVRIP